MWGEFLHSDIRDDSRPGRLVDSGVEIPFGNTMEKNIYTVNPLNTELNPICQ